MGEVCTEASVRVGVDAAGDGDGTGDGASEPPAVGGEGVGVSPGDVASRVGVSPGDVANRVGTRVVLVGVGVRAGVGDGEAVTSWTATVTSRVSSPSSVTTRRAYVVCCRGHSLRSSLPVTACPS